MTPALSMKRVEYVNAMREVARSLDVVLENSIRRSIYEYTLANGFAVFNEIWKALKKSKATINWHIKILKRSGIVEEIRLLKYRIIYVKRFEHVAIKRFLCEKKPSGGYRWERIRRLLTDLCYNDDIESLAGRYGLSSDEVEGLKKLLNAFVDGARGAACARKLARLSCSE
ncbi:MAG: winged helix-turn-helix transcriptional regulator [Crenarchaeota archaeon]|nr:winged helix-turn-helix transcriptional regulator [Thermoproteota archaeon]